jgi:hypothetical protein
VRPPKRKKKTRDNSNRILLIVENSEKEFFQKYFNKFLEREYGLKVDVKSSGSGNKCEITNFKKISSKIELFLDIEKYKSVFLMIDLDTKCFGSNRNHNCLIKLKREYLLRYKIKKELKSRFYLFIVCNEIESWFLTIDKNKKHTNSIHENHKKEIMKLFNVNSEPQIVQRMVRELEREKIKLDISKNKSLQYFIKKLQEFNANP